MLSKGRKNKIRKLLTRLNPEDKPELLIDSLKEDIAEVASKDNGVADLRQTLGTLQESILKKLDGLPDKTSLDELKKNYLDTIGKIDKELRKLIEEQGKTISELPTPEIPEDLDPLKNDLKELRQLILNRGGGAPNQQVAVNGVVATARYADINFISSGATIANDNVKKRTNIILPSSSGGTPASPTRSVQFNNAGSFGGSADLSWSTNKEFIITGNPSTFIADTGNVLVSLEYDAAYAYDNTGKWDNNARVYAYRIVGAVKYFSAMYAEGTTATADQGGTPYRAVFNWNAVAGADGYRVVLLNGSFPVSPGSPPYAPFNYDYYVDVATNSLTDNDDQIYIPYVDGVDNMPTGALNSVDNLWVKGNSRVEQLARFQGGVSIDNTGAATQATEALDVIQNGKIGGVFAVAGAIDANTLINTVKTFVLSDGVSSRGLSIALTGSPSADTTGDMTGIVLNMSAPSASGHTNGGLTGMVMNVSDSSNSTGAVVGANIAVSAAGSSASPSQMYGVFMFASKASAGNISTLEGAKIGVNIGAGGNVGDVYGGEFVLSQNSNNNVANLTNARAGFFNLNLNGEGATTDGAAGYFKLNLAKGGSVVGTASSISIIKGELNVSGGFAPTNLYGIYMPNITGGSTNYSAYFNGGDMYHAGNIKIGVAGSGLYVKEGSNATMGQATLSGGTVVVSTTKVTANSRIFLTIDGGTLTNVGATYISARTAGTSFTISSTNILDASNVSWIIIEPA